MPHSGGYNLLWATEIYLDCNDISCPLKKKKKTPAALQALKRKKQYEKQLAQIDGTLSTIEFQREALENANTNTEVIKNMGFAAKAMKAAHDNMYVIDFLLFCI